MVALNCHDPGPSTSAPNRGENSRKVNHRWANDDQQKGKKQRFEPKKYYAQVPCRDRDKSQYTPLNALVPAILDKSEEASLLRESEPEPIKNPFLARNSKKYYRYHRDNGHHTDQCWALKQGQEEQGKKRRGRKGLYCVGIIFGGPHLADNSQGAQERYVGEARHDPMSVMNTALRPAKVHREEEITFFEKDAVRLYHPHDDALIITPEIGWCEVHRILVDNGSAVNILFQRAFEKMQLDETDLKPASIPLYEFTGDHLIPRGTIALPITLGETNEVTKMTEFLVVDYTSAFNGILGRPLPQSFKAITSIYHLKMKFPTPTGIGEVKRSQRESRDYYIRAVQMACKGKERPLGIPEQAMTISRIEP
ncbi:uncharacterized protein LOC116113251 [Pistacia vera]|uniref:uncharacterized protein LOC116113251 n=1 Tax=Pistacia vera TaxID=55513 RepID=UPI001262E053|nr:uncharacterized protein LOC116113251 [Pistacia vera]